MIDEIVAQWQENEQELHGHRSIPSDLENVYSVPRVRKVRIVTLLDGWIQTRPQEARENNSFNRDKEKLDAD